MTDNDPRLDILTLALAEWAYTHPTTLMDTHEYAHIVLRRLDTAVEPEVKHLDPTHKNTNHHK